MNRSLGEQNLKGFPPPVSGVCFEHEPTVYRFIEAGGYEPWISEQRAQNVLTSARTIVRIPLYKPVLESRIVLKSFEEGLNKARITEVSADIAAIKRIGWARWG